MSATILGVSPLRNLQVQNGELIREKIRLEHENERLTIELAAARQENRELRSRMTSAPPAPSISVAQPTPTSPVTSDRIQRQIARIATISESADAGQAIDDAVTRFSLLEMD